MQEMCLAQEADLAVHTFFDLAQILTSVDLHREQTGNAEHLNQQYLHPNDQGHLMHSEKMAASDAFLHAAPDLILQQHIHIEYCSVHIV